jgi:hypothetical protein
VVKQDEKRIRRIGALMDYSFEVCSLFGDVFITSCNTGNRNESLQIRKCND